MKTRVQVNRYSIKQVRCRQVQSFFRLLANNARVLFHKEKSVAKFS